jgi:peptide/nickel transport system ATP-binding protein/oligopeptide transport system ATP-binding protein
MPRGDAQLEVEDLHMYFPIKGGVLRRKVAELKAVNGISFQVRKGETLGLVGETGCGKTTTGRCIMRLIKMTRGRVFFEGQDISKLRGAKLFGLRRRMQMIFENPLFSLDPCMTVEQILTEPLQLHHLVKRNEYKRRVAELLRLVELEPYMSQRHPTEFSAGQRQRLEIARVLALSPEFIVCDNPVSALDVSIQAQMVTMLTKLKEEFGLTYLLIAHDLAVIRNMSDRVMVMYVGKIVETADTEDLFEHPLHPYTQALLSAVLTPDPKAERDRRVLLLSGEMPSAINPPTGCRFHPRCEKATDICEEQMPELRDIGGGHLLACHRV